MKEKNGILVNALGVSDSGGVAVLDKLLHECTENNLQDYYIVCNKNHNICNLIKKYCIFDNIKFNIIPFKGLLFRLFYENFLLQGSVMPSKIDLIYNFTGSFQPWIKRPQVVKVQNLMFYSFVLDGLYKERGRGLLWVRHILLKRFFFKFMLNKAKYIEVQSSHVKDYLNNFLDIKGKKFFIKSDICIHKNEFHAPRKYDFSKKVRFLYIVGPHFEYPHKNLLDFSEAMLGLKKQGVDFEIDITLSLDQLNGSEVWNCELNKCTNFLGYIDNKSVINSLFYDNTVLISTSVVETLGLHVIEGIKNGVIIITPNEQYADVVYGKNRFSYSLFNSDSLINTINNIIACKESFEERVLSQHSYLKSSEKSKINSINSVFNEVINTQK